MVLGNPIGKEPTPFVYGTSTLCGQTSQTVRLDVTFVTFRPSQHSGQIGPHNTGRTTHAGFHAARFRLFPVRSPLLGKSLLLSLPEVTEMVQFTSFARNTYGFSVP